MSSLVVEQRLESMGASAAAACGLRSCDTPALVALWQVDSSRTRDWTQVPCPDRRIPIYCTTREVQHCFSIPRKSHDDLKYFPLHLPSLTNPLSDLKKIFSRTILRFCFDLFLDEILWEKEIFSFFFLKQSFLHENPLELKGQSLCRERSLLCSGHYGTGHSLCMQKKKKIYIYIYIYIVFPSTTRKSSNSNSTVLGQAHSVWLSSAIDN